MTCGGKGATNHVTRPRLQLLAVGGPLANCNDPQSLDLAPDLVEVEELLVARVQEFGPFAISEVMVSKIDVSNHAQYLVNLVPKSSFQFLA